MNNPEFRPLGNDQIKIRDRDAEGRKRAEVLYGLKDVYGNTIADRYIKNITENEGSRITFVMGEAGNGKTIFANQLISEVTEENIHNLILDGKPTETVYTTFDLVRAYFIEHYGPTDGWEPLHWNELNTAFSEQILEISSDVTSGFARRHVVVELPAIPAVQVTGVDRVAYGVFENFAKEARRLKSLKYQFLTIIADPRIRLRSVEVRNAVIGSISQGSVELKSLLQKDFNILVRSRSNAGIDEIELAMRIVEHFKHTAQEAHINRIHGEMMRMVEIWEGKQRNPKKKSASIDLPIQTPSMLLEHKEEVLRKARFMHYIIHEKLKLSQTSATVAINPYYRNVPIHLDLD